MWVRSQTAAGSIRVSVLNRIRAEFLLSKRRKITRTTARTERNTLLNRFSARVEAGKTRQPGGFVRREIWAVNAVWLVVWNDNWNIRGE